MVLLTVTLSKSPNLILFDLRLTIFPSLLSQDVKCDGQTFNITYGNPCSQPDGGYLPLYQDGNSD